MRRRGEGPAALADMSKVLFAIAGVLVPKRGRRLRDFGREDLRPFQVVPGLYNTILEVGGIPQSRLGDGLRREAQVPALRAVVALRAFFVSDGAAMAYRWRLDAIDATRRTRKQTCIFRPSSATHR